MNYQVIHDSIIQRAKDRLLEGYGENHHIIPICMGGYDDISNIVRLTAREHFVVHQLLVKMYPKQEKLIYAMKMMTVGHQDNRINNRMYEWIRNRLSSVHSARLTGRKASDETKRKMSAWQIGKKHSNETKARISQSLIGKNTAENHHMYGKKHSEETKRKMSEAHRRKK